MRHGGCRAETKMLLQDENNVRMSERKDRREQKVVSGGIKQESVRQQEDVTSTSYPDLSDQEVEPQYQHNSTMSRS